MSEPFNPGKDYEKRTAELQIPPRTFCGIQLFSDSKKTLSWLARCP